MIANRAICEIKSCKCDKIDLRLGGKTNLLSQFELFKGGPTVSPRDRLYVTINAKSVIYINSAVFEALGSPAAVALLYDRVNCIIGVTEAYPKNREAFPLIFRKGQILVQATPFCRHYGINLDRTMKFTDPEIDDNGMLRLDLRKLTAAGWQVYKPKKKKQLAQRRILGSEPRDLAPILTK